jgi:hypothetical protein
MKKTVKLQYIPGLLFDWWRSGPFTTDGLLCARQLNEVFPGLRRSKPMWLTVSSRRPKDDDEYIEVEVTVKYKLGSLEVNLPEYNVRHYIISETAALFGSPPVGSILYVWVEQEV